MEVNNIQQIWEQWKPSKDLSGNYYIEEVHDDYDGFTVILSTEQDEQQGIKMFFEGGVQSYLYADETYRTKLFSQLYNGTLGYLGTPNWSFFKVTNSPYLQWIEEQSCGISTNRNLKHFSIIGGNSVLDIIDGLEPAISFITRDKKEQEVGAVDSLDTD